MASSRSGNDGEGTERSPMFLHRILLRWLLILLSAAVIGATGGSRQAWATAGYPGIRLAVVNSVPVFVSAFGLSAAHVACPRVPLRIDAAGRDEGAVALATAIPAFYRLAVRVGHPSIDARGAVVRIGRSSSARVGSDFQKLCGPLVWARSLYGVVRLPHVRFSASLSQPSFELARTRLGWIIWAEVH